MHRTLAGAAGGKRLVLDALLATTLLAATARPKSLLLGLRTLHFRCPFRSQRKWRPPGTMRQRDDPSDDHDPLGSATLLALPDCAEGRTGAERNKADTGWRGRRSFGRLPHANARCHYQGVAGLPQEDSKNRIGYIEDSFYGLTSVAIVGGTQLIHGRACAGIVLCRTASAATAHNR